MLHVKDSTIDEILTFLEKASIVGKSIVASADPTISTIDPLSLQSISYEAGQLKAIFLALSS